MEKDYLFLFNRKEQRMIQRKALNIIVGNEVVSITDKNNKVILTRHIPLYMKMQNDTRTTPKELYFDSKCYTGTLSTNLK